MNKSNSNPKADTIDYYSIVSRIRPRRSPSIYHKEYHYYWTDFPMPPVYTIFNTTFHKVTPLSHCVDCSRYGQLHYWARAGSIYSPVLVVVYFSPPNRIIDIRFFFFAGRIVDTSENGMTNLISPEEESFRICLSGFLKEFLSETFYFDDKVFLVAKC